MSEFKPVRKFLLTVVDIVSAIAKNWLTRKVNFSRRPGAK